MTAARQGDPGGYKAVQKCYCQGVGVDSDSEMALAWGVLWSQAYGFEVSFEKLSDADCSSYIRQYPGSYAFILQEARRVRELYDLPPPME